MVHRQHPHFGAALNHRIDEAYRAKYKGSPYLAPMVGKQARAATIKITPRAA